ncbi:uncharacterized protein BDW70DRAFT_133199 [Aspergillus foveolatus]|uniref:uncharacterized protein n=1 Tax=Aspergillus foveolatus TaxID=210207 RepID=UPI003CCE0D89
MFVCSLALLHLLFKDSYTSLLIHDSKDLKSILRVNSHNEVEGITYITQATSPGILYHYPTYPRLTESLHLQTRGPKYRYP